MFMKQELELAKKISYGSITDGSAGKFEEFEIKSRPKSGNQTKTIPDFKKLHDEPKTMKSKGKSTK